MCELSRALEAVERLGSKAAAARELNIPVSTLKGRYRKALETRASPAPDERVIHPEASGLSLVDVREAAGLDDSWHAVDVYANDAGVKTAKFRREPPADRLEEHLDRLVSRLSLPLPTPPERPPEGDLMVEFGLHDAHFGKLCWGRETGQDYNLALAEAIYATAVDDLLSRVRSENIHSFLFPIGSDFFNADNFQSTTHRGTPVEGTDDRFQKVFETGEAAIIRAITEAAKIAPVRVTWVPGNHDTSSSWYLARVVSAWFRNSSHVTVDTGPKLRKYVEHGVVLLGLTHGHLGKRENLALRMATDVPHLFAKCPVREWHLGHLHKLMANEEMGVRWRVLPSLSATDLWHDENDFVHNRRAAEAYLWSSTEGYVGHFSVNARIG